MNVLVDLVGGVCGGGVLDRRDVLDLMHGQSRMTIWCLRGGGWF